MVLKHACVWFCLMPQSAVQNASVNWFDGSLFYEHQLTTQLLSVLRLVIGVMGPCTQRLIDFRFGAGKRKTKSESFSDFLYLCS